MPLISLNPKGEAWPLTTATKNALAKNRKANENKKRHRKIQESKECETKQKTAKQMQREAEDTEAEAEAEEAKRRRSENLRSKCNKTMTQAIKPKTEADRKKEWGRVWRKRMSKRKKGEGTGKREAGNDFENHSQCQREKCRISRRANIK